MRFFSGFSLHEESELFSGYLTESVYTVAGFSKGAIDALEYCIAAEERIDLLQMISPAFFMDREISFKEKQLEVFRKNSSLYLKQFLRNIAYPLKKDLTPYLAEEGEEELQRLLYYPWEKEKLQAVKARGIRMEVYLGGRDKIINPTAAMAYFRPYATVYFIKEGGHILDGQN